MQAPIPTREIGAIFVLFGLLVIASAVVLFSYASEQTTELLVILAIEVLAGLGSIGWGGSLVRGESS